MQRMIATWTQNGKKISLVYDLQNHHLLIEDPRKSKMPQAVNLTEILARFIEKGEFINKVGGQTL